MGFLDKLFGKKKREVANLREEPTASETSAEEPIAVAGEETDPATVAIAEEESPVEETAPIAEETRDGEELPVEEPSVLATDLSEDTEEQNGSPIDASPIAEESKIETDTVPQEASAEEEEPRTEDLSDNCAPSQAEEGPARETPSPESEEDTEEQVEAVSEEIRKSEKKSFWKRVREGLAKTKSALFGQIDDLLKNFVKVDEDLLEELEELLICADVGVNAAEDIMEQLRERIKDGRLKEKEQVLETLQAILSDMIGEGESLRLETAPSVVLVIGVNGVGKTTSIGKISNQLRKQGKKVVVAAADTFRAAAIDQLAVWCDRAKVELVRQNEGSDPAAVVFDACHVAKNKKADVLIIDTAGRLHNKTNLMNELAKIDRVIDRELPGACRENLLVLDATTGQNAISQAKEFKNAASLTGLILNKLDGTAKGGIVISIRKELNIPVKFIGVGEKLDDMQEFDQAEFVNALFTK